MEHTPRKVHIVFTVECGAFLAMELGFKVTGNNLTAPVANVGDYCISPVAPEAAGRLVAAYFTPNIEDSPSQRKIPTLDILNHLMDVRKEYRF